VPAHPRGAGYDRHDRYHWHRVPPRATPAPVPVPKRATFHEAVIEEGLL
jgi:hypothetical protein